MIEVVAADSASDQGHGTWWLVPNRDHLRGSTYFCEYGDRKWARHPALWLCA